MSRYLFMPYVAMLTFALSANPVVASMAAARTHAELVEALIAAQPKDPDANQPREQRRDHMLAELAQTAPGKVAVAKPILDREVQCANGVSDNATTTLLRAAFSKLTDSELGALIDYFTGPAFARLGVLDDKTNRTAAENAELAAIRQRYPFARLEAVMQEATAAVPRETIRQAFVACHDVATHALAAEGLSQ